MSKIVYIIFVFLIGCIGCVDEYKFNAKVAELSSTQDTLKQEQRDHKLCKFDLDQSKQKISALEKVIDVNPLKTNVTEKQKNNSKVKYKLELTIQVDGHPEINSTHELIDSGQPVLLPDSLWECMLRPTFIENNVKEFIGTPVEGKTFYNKELVCFIQNKQTREFITQAGTGTACVQNQVTYESNFLYIREGNRIFKFELICYQ